MDAIIIFYIEHILFFLVVIYGKNGKETYVKNVYTIITTLNKEGEKFGI
jgi:hypothetical protein